MKKNNLAIALTLLIISCVYFSIPNYRHLSDGLIAALRIRQSTHSWFVHPNHPAHPLIPLIIYNAIGRDASGISELELLQLWSTFLGIATCIIYAYTICFIGTSLPGSLFALLLLAFSHGIWFFSTAANPQATALMTNVLLLSVLVTMSGAKNESLFFRYLLTIAAICALAVFSSQLNALMLIPSIYIVLVKRGSAQLRAKCVMLLILYFLLFTAILYILVGLLFLNFNNPADFYLWQRSYVYQSRWWALNVPDLLQRNALGLVRVFIAIGSELTTPMKLPDASSSIFNTPPAILSIIAIVFSCTSLFVMVIATFRDWWRNGLENTVQNIAMLAFAPMFIFCSVWVPETYHYRILYVPSLILFIVPYIDRRFNIKNITLKGGLVPFSLVFCIFFNNLLIAAIPESNPSNNPYFYETTLLSRYLNQSDIVIYLGTDEGRTKALYTQYFIGSRVDLIDSLISEYRKRPDDTINDIKLNYRNYPLILIHQDALNPSREDTELLRIQYGTDINNAEITRFLDNWAKPAGLYDVINDNSYYKIHLN